MFVCFVIGFLWYCALACASMFASSLIAHSPFFCFVIGAGFSHHCYAAIDTFVIVVLFMYDLPQLMLY